LIRTTKKRSSLWMLKSKLRMKKNCPHDLSECRKIQSACISFHRLSDLSSEKHLNASVAMSKHGNIWWVRASDVFMDTVCDPNNDNNDSIWW
jgi:hypothetical protein